MPLKQAIVVRSDLGMGKGKIAAQAAHASLAAVRKAKAGDVDEWEASGCAKIVLKVQGERELLAVFTAAKDGKLPAALIKDAGHTQIAAGTATAVAVGPADKEKVDAITGGLKLL